MNISNSPDIQTLSILATFDISGTLPVVLLENQSTGPNLAGVSYAFIIKSPSQTFIHDGNINTPDITGVWSTTTLSDQWPRPFGNLEFSGAPYSFQVVIKDSAGNVYYGPVQDAAICRPNGNLPTSKNAFGLASVLVQVNCEQGRIYFQDTTNSSYKGLDGTIGSSVLRVNFPMDNTGTVPAPFVGANFSTALVPITYSGKGYQYLVTSIYEYELSENTFVRIKYLKSDTFGVWCNIDLMPLICEYQKLIDSIESGNCSNAEEANRKMMRINPKFSMVVMGMFQPLTGIDVPALIEEIKVIGGFDCDCCNAPSGIVPTNSSIIGGYNFSVAPLGGDIQGTFVPNGNNIQLQLSDKSYVFKMCDGSPAQTTAFEVFPSLSSDGYTKTYCLYVDVVTLAEEILNAISTDASLVNLFNSIVNSSGEGTFELIVDGGCIFDSSASCNYTFTFTTIPVNTTFAILSSIQALNGNITPNFAFNLTNLPSLQTYLNSLGIGTYTVTNPSGQTVLVTSNTNSSNLLGMVYKNPTTNVSAMTKNCTGYVPISANQVVQNIISYLCAIDDSQIATSADYQICYIDPLTGEAETATVSAGAPLSDFLTELTTRGCQTINYIISLSASNCTAIKALFPSNINVMEARDVFLGTKQGACSGMTPVEAFLYMLTYGQYNADVLSAFCDMVNLCAGGNPCAPYDVFYASVTDGSPTDTLVVTFSHPNAVSNTIRYARIDNTVTPVYTTIPGILPGASPYSITGISNGQYRVYIRPIYADGRLCAESVYDTPACTGVNAFSAEFDGSDINVTYNVDPSVPNVRVVVNYPNGGTSTTVYANGDAISITPPPSVFGTYFLTLQPVCDLSTGFFGAPTPPVSVLIQQNNSTFTNQTGSSKALSVTGNGTQQYSGFVANSGVAAFYLPDGFYSTILAGVSFPTGTYIVSLTTGASTYYATQIGAASYQFTNILVSGGATMIVTTNTSPSGSLFEVNNNSVSGATINNVTPVVYSFTSGGFPVLSAGSASGVHTGFTAQFSVNITSSGSFNLAIYKNGGLASIVIPVTSSGTYTFPTTFTALNTDDVEIRLYP